MLFTADPRVARDFCHNFALSRSFLLSVELLAGATLAERANAIADIAEQAKLVHERWHNARR